VLLDRGFDQAATVVKAIRQDCHAAVSLAVVARGDFQPVSWSC
jgi:hypothetical protein